MPKFDEKTKSLTFSDFTCLSCEYTTADLAVCKCRENCGENKECLDKCGPSPTPIRKRDGFSYKIEVWYSEEPVGAFPSKDVIPDESFESDPGGINKFPGCFMYGFGKGFDTSKSICIKTNVVFHYTDGSCCAYQDRQCFNIN